MVKQCVTVPVYVMVRPRGGDFCYSDTELQVMKEDIAAFKRVGANGFVFGILHEQVLFVVIYIHLDTHSTYSH